MSKESEVLWNEWLKTDDGMRYAGRPDLYETTRLHAAGREWVAQRIIDRRDAELSRLRNINARLLAACEKLDKFQTEYEALTHNMMPGNELYADWLMKIVLVARAAISLAKDTP